MASNPQKVGKYEIDSLLGRGGMGEVYKAHDPALGRYVALKIMHGPALDDPSLRERFIREAQAAGGMRHPNIVTVYDLGEFDGQLFIAMEFIRGNDLEKIIKDRVALTVEQKLGIMIQVCEGIAYAHKNQIVHRDLKPANIRIDEEGIAKIMDFGIAKMEASNMTASGTVLGTPFYMSPEQVRGMRVDTRSDLFSLGAILYEFFTYKKAFTGELATVFYKIVQEQPQPIGQYLNFRADLLQNIVDRCLEKDKNKRVQTCNELADLLRRAQFDYRNLSAETVIGVEQTPATFQLAAAPSVITRSKGPASAPSGAQSIPPPLTEPPPLPASMTPAAQIPSTPASASSWQSQPPPHSIPATGPALPTHAMPDTVASKGVPIWILLLLLLFFVGGAGGIGAYFLLRDRAAQPGQQTGPVSDPQIEEPAKNGGSPYSAELAAAKELYQQSKYDEAILIYNRLIEQHPSDAELHFLNGAAKKKAAKNQEALLKFQKAVELNEKHDQAWQQIGFLLMNRMDYAGAETAFQKAITYSPNVAATWEGLAQTYLVSQQTAKAEQAYHKLLEIEPNNLAAVYNLGQLQWAGKNVAAAKESFRRVIEMNPNYAEAHNNLGAIYLSEGQVAQSILENEKAVLLKPGLASAHYSLFLAYEQRQEYKLASSHLEKYLELTGDEDPQLREKLKQYQQ